MPKTKKAEAKAAVLSLFERAARPVLIGHASLNLGWPLSWCERIFQELVDEQQIRPCTSEELHAFDLKDGYFRAK